jgi:hypothetical protein
MNEATELNQKYAVEVSGWDQEEKFFVEHTRLEWHAQNPKKVVLRHLIKTGTTVFLRLLKSANPPPILAVAYRAVRIQPAAERDCSEVQLDQLWPEQSAMGGKNDGPATGRGIPASRPIFHIESLLRESFAPNRKRIS